MFFAGLAVSVFFSSYTNSNYQHDDLDTSYIDTIKLGLGEIQTDPEKSLGLLTKSYEHCMQKKDFGNAIRCLIGITDIERFRGNYNLAFEKLWDALLLTDKYGNEKNIITIHRNLGILYGIYNKDSSAINHLSLSLKKAKILNEKESVKNGEIIASYFSLSSIYRDNEQYDLALNYLDSCYLLNPDKNLPYVETDKGYLYLKMGNLKLAEKHLYNASKYLTRNNERYLVVCYSFIGDLKLAQNEPDSALYYYSKSLNTIEAKKAYVEFRPDLLRKISSLHLKKNNYVNAYNYLNASTKVSDSLFNATSDQNNKLFEIKNKYKEALLEKETLLQAQNVLIEQKNAAQVRLRLLIGLIVLLGVSGFLFFRLRVKLKKLSLKQIMEMEKNSAVLEVKSKELTTYALQMIDKEKALHELLEIIREVAPGKHHSLHSKYANRNNKLWEEFNMRFVEVNSDFYEKLREKYPDLTPTEQKHCALIRLNFDSNEMAQILNISLQSIHTSRYRIRKKLKLLHETSLSNFIAEL
ncbi:hypothetical protein ALGA_3573 [Labilibaculum antarcticum]|uniref:Uncharacterized protein n=1 Tax=Labilibaculum antarcticum TaxID=1717717 RepID=A0A1Y1CRJ8_9BACT|nr:hypothetical protein ALGA_3573 [Labilibaculum antarcticum]